MKQHAFHLIVLIFLTLAAQGQQEKKRSCRILFLERPDKAPASLHLFDGQTAREVDLPSMNLSKSYELPVGDMTLTLLPTWPIDPKQIPAGAPKCFVPAAVNDFYLLVMNDPTNRIAPVSFQIVDTGAAMLSPGKTLWFNLTEYAIGGKLGSETIVLKPKSRDLMNAPRSDTGDYPVSFWYRANDDEKKNTPYPICETLWTHDPQNRNLGFIFNVQGSRTPRIFVFPDIRND
jgi:hypothetical protein